MEEKNLEDHCKGSLAKHLVGNHYCGVSMNAPIMCKYQDKTKDHNGLLKCMCLAYYVPKGGYKQ